MTHKHSLQPVWLAVPEDHDYPAASSYLSLLGVSNSYVEKDRKKIPQGIPMSPLLPVRASSHDKVIVADGYHRLCAVYAVNEDALIPCKIA